MQSELFEEYQPKEPTMRRDQRNLIQDAELNKLASLTLVLQTHIESINRLKEAISQLLDAIKKGYFEEQQRLLAYLRLERFKNSSDILLFSLTRSRLHLPANDPNQERLEALNQTFSRNEADKNDVDICECLKKIIGLDHFDWQQIGIFAQQLNKIITKLNEMEGLVYEVENNTNSQDFFNAAAKPLEDEQVAFIMKYAPENINSLLSSIDKNLPGLRLLLYGPPGNGKTTFAQAIAQFCNRPFFMMRIASTGNKYQFSQEKDFNTINSYLDRHPNGIILLDEIDCAFTDKKDNDKSAKNLCDIIKFAKTKYPQAAFIATTNCDIQYAVDNTITRDESGQKQFPAALKSLFGQDVCKVDNPGEEYRKAIIDYYCKQYSTRNTINLSDADKWYLVKKTKNFSIRDIESMFARAEQLLIGAAGAENIAQRLAKFQGIPTQAQEVKDQGPHIINREIMERARDNVFQSIITKQPWRKRIADCYHIAERTLTLVSLATSCANPFIQLYWRCQDIRNQQTYHNSTHAIAEQVEFRNGRWQHIDNDQNRPGLVGALVKKFPVFGTDPSNYNYEWKDGAWRRAGRIPVYHPFTKSDVEVPYPTGTTGKS